MAETKEKEKKLVVVAQYPTQAMSEVEQDGQVYECKTIEDALAEALEILRELKKKL